MVLNVTVSLTNSVEADAQNLGIRFLYSDEVIDR